MNKKMTRNFLLLLFISTVFACTETSMKTAEDKTVTIEEKDPLEGYVPIDIELSEGTLQMMVPSKQLAGNEPEVYMSNAGVTNVILSKKFHIEIIESPMPMESIKMDLERDIFYKTSIVEDEADQLIYEKELPDHSKKFVHFIKRKTINNQEISIRSAVNGEFKRSHVDRMLKSANTFSQSENLVSSVQ